MEADPRFAQHEVKQDAAGIFGRLQDKRVNDSFHHILMLAIE